MHVVCPNCKYDAGDIPEVTVGQHVECDCGFKWVYDGPPKTQSAIKPISKKIAKKALGVASIAAKATGSFVAASFKKAQKHIARKQFEKNLPSRFLKAIQDGVVTPEEEQQIRNELDKHAIPWTQAVAQIKPLAKEFARRVFTDMIADNIITPRENAELQHYLEMFDVREEIRPQAKEFIRRILAETIADSEVTAEERAQISEYINYFHLDEMRPEVNAVLGRVETIWKLNNNVLPNALDDKPLWLKSDEALYFKTDAHYLRKLRDEFVKVPGEFCVTNTRFEFTAMEWTVSHPHEQLRRCDASRRTHLSLLFHPRAGSGTYIVPDAPMAGAYLNAFARAANRTISITREGVTIDERRRIPKEVKHEVWIRDQGKCINCNAEDYLEFDHIIPVSRGGANTTNNIQLLCRRCNSQKADRI